MKTYTIHLIRHGIIDGNLEGRYIGSTDKPLCDEGRALIKEYKQKYGYPKADVIFSSPMKRCVETAELIYGKQPAVIPDFRECDFGDFEDKSEEELKEIEEFKNWRGGDFSYRPPNGESWKDLAERLKVAFIKVTEAMMSTKTENAVIVTHGGVIMTLMSMFAFPQKEPTEWFVKNGCGITITTDLKCWMRAQLFEATSNLPIGKEDIFVTHRREENDDEK